MIVRQFNNPVVLYQTPDGEYEIAEPAICISTDASGLIVVQQGGDTILINRASVKELCKALLATPSEERKP